MSTELFNLPKTFHHSGLVTAVNEQTLHSEVQPNTAEGETSEALPSNCKYCIISTSGLGSLLKYIELLTSTQG